MRTDMAYEEIVVTTPLKRKVKVQMKNLGDDVWDTSLFYANQVRRVGKFKGKDFAREAATKKAIEIADAPPSTGSIICGDDDPACKKPITATHEAPRLEALKRKTPLKSPGRKESS
jgi:hypothetical protein